MNFIQIILLIAAVLTGALALFQLLLAAGLPLGRFAWGGQNIRLPKQLRIFSSISSILLVYASIVVLERSEIINIIDNKAIIAISSGIFVFIFGLSTLGNLTSKSKSEKKVMTPIAIYLVVAFLLAIIR